MSLDPELRPVGRVESPLIDLAAAPRQGDEGAPEAWLAFDAAVADAMHDLAVGDQVVVLTWLDRARREVLTTHPRDDVTAPELGVFSTRSPDRPNPIGLHTVRIVAIGRDPGPGRRPRGRRRHPDPRRQAGARPVAER